MINVQSVDDTRDVTQNRQENVDEEVGAAAALEQDSDGREEDGEDDLEDVAGEGVVSFLSTVLNIEVVGLAGREAARIRW